MSRRPTSRKQVARLRKALRRTPDSISTSSTGSSCGHRADHGPGKQLLIDGKVRSNSHPRRPHRAQLPGTTTSGCQIRFVPARLRDSLIVG